MLVVATAGHVDHGKTTLLRALTGMEPDRLVEERRRGLTIELGFVWTTLADGTDVAFVDVPGHERFLPTMLAGVGPVPAVLFVVAADEGWRQQSEEHLTALLTLGVRHAVVAVTRSDLADPRAAATQVRRRLAGGPLAGAAVVPVAAPTGTGLDRLRTALREMSVQVPAPDPDADVRLWLDRSFTVRGAGTVVTGTLAAGRVAVGDRLCLLPGAVEVRVRGVQTLHRDTQAVAGTARVALNLRGLARTDVPRGSVLTTAGRFLDVDVVDVQVRPALGPPTAPAGLTVVGARPAGGSPPTSVTVHVGAAAVPARVRPLPPAAGTAPDDRPPALVRLTLSRTLPLRVGDRLLLRDPGTRALWGADVLDVAPPRLVRRGQAADRARALARTLDGEPAARGYVRTRGLVRADDLARAGLPDADGLVERAGWLAEPVMWGTLAARARTLVGDHDAADPLNPGLPLDELRHAMEAPDASVVRAVADDAGLVVAQGRVCRPGGGPGLGTAQAGAVAALRERLAARPYDAPTGAELVSDGLGPEVLAAAERAGLVWRPAPGLVLLPGAGEQAADVLARLDQPFTVSGAAQALGCSRRVAVPLLEWLDRAGLTRRSEDSRRTVRSGDGGRARS